MRIAGITSESLIDGPGIRLVVFTQGCNKRCKGCHNPSTHAIDGGRDASVDEILSHLTPLTTGITISGGEPMLQIPEVFKLLQAAKERGLTTILYTGLTLDELRSRPNDFIAVMKHLDAMKVGPYIEELKSLDRPYGSSNQEMLYNLNSDIPIQ